MTLDLDLLDRIVSTLRARRFPVDTEATLQAAISEALIEAGIAFTAEYRLDARNRVDFFADGIGIEAKIGGGRLAIWRQVERYAAFDEIRATVLVGSIAMPSDIAECGGKPFRYVSLGKAWM